MRKIPRLLLLTILLSLFIATPFVFAAPPDPCDTPGQGSAKYWFYIEETDQPSKRAFTMTSIMWRASIAAAADQQPAPILTVPVSR